MSEELIRAARELSPDAFGGARWEADRLVIGFTRHPVALAAELRRRTQEAFFVALTRFAERDLEHVMERIDRDRGHLEDAGIRLIAVGLGVDRVRMEVATERPAEAVGLVADRYGPAVQLEILGASTEVSSLAAIEHWTPGDDDRTLRLAWQAGGGARLLRIELDEHADAVSAGAVVATGYVVTADWRTAVAEVRLSDPLGDRTLIDARSGREIRRT